MAQGLSAAILRLAGYVLAGLAVASLMLGFWLAQRALLFADDVVRTTGIIVGYRETPRSDGATAFTPRIVFESTPGQLTTPSPRDPVGTAVPVRYQRGDPGGARVDRFVDNTLGPAVATRLGLLCALLAAVLTRGSRSAHP